MSRTYRFYHTDWYMGFRCPKGRRNAINNNARKGAIPPDTWDDIPVNRETWMPYRIGKKLSENGVECNKAIKKLVKKFNISHYVARNIMADAIRSNAYKLNGSGI